MVISIYLATYDFLSLIYPRVDKRQPVYALYIHMSKAFYCVGHNVLLKKLKEEEEKGVTL